MNSGANTLRSAPTRWQFDALTRDELSAAAPEVTVLVPLGSTEQHGHHLPVGVDRIVVEALAARAADLASEHIPILVTPTLPIGFAEHHVPFGGTISLTATTYVEVLTDIGRSLVRQGFRRIVYLNGHGGNDSALKLALDRLAFDERVEAHVAGAAYWDVAAEALADVDFEAGLVPGHAGHFETSMLLALAPELVLMELRPDDRGTSLPLSQPTLPGVHAPDPSRWQRSDGRTDDAARASVELGRHALETVAKAIADFLVQFHRSTRS